VSGVVLGLEVGIVGGLPAGLGRPCGGPCGRRWQALQSTDSEAQAMKLLAVALTSECAASCIRGEAEQLSIVIYGADGLCKSS
jgi:hypothetical protein